MIISEKTIKSLKIKPPNTIIRKILSLFSSPYLREIIPDKKLRVAMINPYNKELNITVSIFPLKNNPITTTTNKNGITKKRLFNFIFFLILLFQIINSFYKVVHSGTNS